jgi:hypothetical protein
MLKNGDVKILLQSAPQPHPICTILLSDLALYKIGDRFLTENGDIPAINKYDTAILVKFCYFLYITI